MWGEWKTIVPSGDSDNPVVKGRFCDGCSACEYEDGSIVPMETMGFCGYGAQWQYYEGGLLYINGEGDLWHEVSRQSIHNGWTLSDYLTEGQELNFDSIDTSKVKRVLIDECVGCFGAGTMDFFRNLEEITFLNHGPDLQAALPDKESSVTTDASISMNELYSSLREFYESRQVLPSHITIYYPADDASWTKEVKNIMDKTGNRWVSIGQDSRHLHTWSEWKRVPHLEEGTLQSEKIHFCEDCGACESEEGNITLRCMGFCKENARWMYYEGGLLYIKGKVGIQGSRPSWIGWSSQRSEYPAYLDETSIKRVLLENVKEIKPRMFEGWNCLEEIVFLGHAPDLEACPGENFAEYSTLKELYDANNGVFLSRRNNREEQLNVLYPENDST